MKLKIWLQVKPLVITRTAISHKNPKTIAELDGSKGLATSQVQSRFEAADGAPKNVAWPAENQREVTRDLATSGIKNDDEDDGFWDNTEVEDGRDDVRPADSTP